jgi:hypothetical protein
MIDAEEDMKLHMKMGFPYIWGRAMSTGKDISKELRISFLYKE